MNGKWARGWNALATSWLVGSTAFLALNAAVWAARRWPRPRTNPVLSRFGEAIYRGYPEWPRASVDALLNETWLAPQFEYEAFTQFREIPRRGRYVNVSEHGFRIATGSEPWPPDGEAFNVFVFGGSNTFGYGVPDSDTVPAQLRRRLEARGIERLQIYNFGRGHYYSAQERVLFEKLIVEGHRPHLAVFLDGSNEIGTLSRFGGARFTETLKRLMRQASQPRPGVEIPLTRLLADLRDPPGKAEPAPPREARLPAPAVVEHYLRNKSLLEAIGAASGVAVALVWQPIATYKYDLRLHPLRDEVRAFPSVYEHMAKVVAERELGDAFIWCADVQVGVTRPLYVDPSHYNAAGADLVAGCIDDALEARGILARAAATSSRPPRNPSGSASARRAP